MRATLPDVARVRRVAPMAVVAALDADCGEVSSAAARLGWSYARLRYQLRKDPHLNARVVRMRRGRLDQRRLETLHLLERHQGNIEAAARSAGLSKSTFFSRVKRGGLYKSVLTLRPKPPTRTDEKRALQDALRRHCGHRSRMRHELLIGEGRLRARLIKHNLLREADALSAEYTVMGPRTKLPRGQEFQRRRAKLLRLIESCGWDLRKATQSAKLAPATFFENMRILEIDRRRDTSEFRSRETIIDALRNSRGIVARAAASIGCPGEMLRDWCAELDIHPSDFR